MEQKVQCIKCESTDLMFQWDPHGGLHKEREKDMNYAACNVCGTKFKIVPSFATRVG